MLEAFRQWSQAVLDPWVWRVSWRESRFSRRRLLFYTSFIVLGISALVAIRASGNNLRNAIRAESKALLGADLVIRARQPFDEETESLLNSIAGRQAREVRFSSMAIFPEAGTRLVEVRAVDSGFPFYGGLETDPPQASRSPWSNKSALVDQTLLLQYGAKAGDRLQLGATTFTIAGALKSIPGESLTSSIIHPRIYISRQYLDDTELIQVGSRARHRAYYQLDPGVDADALSESLRDRMAELRLRSDTVSEREDRIGRTLANLYRFLNLVGFVALLLGGIGVASAIHVYIKQKISVVATFRCLGAKPAQTFMIYLIQALAMGLVGATVGVLLGLGIQRVLPEIVSDFLPVDVRFELDLPSILMGFSFGLVLTLLFALLPLVSLRKISPFQTLRASSEITVYKKDWTKLAILGLLGLVTLLFSIFNTRYLWQGVWFALGLFAALLILALGAWGLTRLVRGRLPTGWPYVWRQGLANIYRPQNQTTILVMTIGLGLFLILTVYFVQTSLLEEVASVDANQRPNLVFFDIQTDQRPEILRMVQDQGLPVLQDVPVVTMRLMEVKGELVADTLRKRGGRRGSTWAFRREYRSTYRNSLTDTETLVAGTLWAPTPMDGSGVVPVSLEREIASELDVKLGDILTFDVQGVPIQAQVWNVREVEWERFQPNFFVVFPEGVLENAPQFSVVVTRAATEEQSALLQREMVRRFPNVSSIDLHLVLKTVDAVLAQVMFVVRFIALFSILTGLAVLVGAVLSSRFQRIRESVLLRTLGASRKQITQILLVEYCLLGALAVALATALSLASGWALSRFVFEIAFGPQLWMLLVFLLLVMVLTGLVGWITSRGIVGRPPMEVLRHEGR